MKLQYTLGCTILGEFGKYSLKRKECGIVNPSMSKIINSHEYELEDSTYPRIYKCYCGFVVYEKNQWDSDNVEISFHSPDHLPENKVFLEFPILCKYTEEEHVIRGIIE